MLATARSFAVHLGLELKALSLLNTSTQVLAKTAETADNSACS
jgi:hypothetical protein